MICNLERQFALVTCEGEARLLRIRDYSMTDIWSLVGERLGCVVFGLVGWLVGLSYGLVC